MVPARRSIFGRPAPVLLALATLLMVPRAGGEWALLDDFNDGPLGTLDGRTSTQGTWDTDGENTSRVFVTVEGAGPVLRWRAQDGGSTTGDREFAGPLGALSIPNESSAATLFLRFRHGGDGGYQRFGLWDEGGTNAAGVGPDTIDLQFILLDDTAAATNKFRLVSREAAGAVTLDDGLDVGTWYALWVVLDQTADTYDVYLKGGAYATTQLVRADAPFRNPAGASLNGFVGQGYRNPSFTVTSDLDDIHLDVSGANLSEPGAAEPPEPKAYDVYLIGGQSNADGRGNTNELTGALASYAETQPDVRLFYANPTNDDPAAPTHRTGWVPLKPGYAAPPGFSGSLPSDRFGFELSFGRTLADRHPGRNIALLKVSKGGTSLHTDWDPTGGANYMWRTFTNQVSAALADLVAEGSTYTVRGMIWHQGESDGGNPTYEADLAQFVAAVRAFLGRPQLAFAIGELERDDVTPTVTSRNHQLAAMAAVDAADPFSGLVSSAGLGTVDGTHFDTDAVIVFGQRYADAVDDIDRDGLPDEWEVHNLGSVTNSAGAASDDWDGDRFPDRSEFEAGTDPASAASYLGVSAFPPPGPEGLVLTWSSVTGRAYRVQRAEALRSAWTNVVVVPATPPWNSYTDAVPAAAGGFYRVEAHPPL